MAIGHRRSSPPRTVPCQPYRLSARRRAPRWTAVVHRPRGRRRRPPSPICSTGTLPPPRRRRGRRPRDRRRSSPSHPAHLPLRETCRDHQTSLALDPVDHPELPPVERLAGDRGPVPAMDDLVRPPQRRLDHEGREASSRHPSAGVFGENHLHDDGSVCGVIMLEVGGARR